MKRIITLWAVLIFLSGCGETRGIEAEAPNFDTALSRLAEDMQAGGAENLTLQKELARWYNFGLADGSSTASASAYNSILFYTDGILGAVEFPSLSLRQPIYHGTGCAGFGHDPTTPFPIGEMGNHSVLVTEQNLSLAIGDRFIIHILEEKLTYRVIAIRQEPDTTAVADMDYCSILLPGQLQILGIREEETAVQR